MRRTYIKGSVQDICQLTDGMVYALVYDEESKKAYDDWTLREMEAGSFFYTEGANGKPVGNYKAGYDPIIESENGVEAYR